MDKYFVLGNPVAKSKSPLIHARFAELTGQALPCERLLTSLGGFTSTLTQLVHGGSHGCNVTLPFKFEAYQAASTQTDRPQLAQAANTLTFANDAIHADNTDGAGLVKDIQNNAGVLLAGCDVLLLGAGGAAAFCAGIAGNAGAADMKVRRG